MGNGLALPVRIRVVPRGWTARPALGPPWRGAGAGDTVIAADGRARIPLAPGEYRVIATAGPEWSLGVRDVEVKAGRELRLPMRLTREVDAGEWIPCDFHVHGDASRDSRVSTRDRVASFLAEGVRFAVVTDHNRVTDYADAVREVGRSRLAMLPGAEVTTWTPEVGHFNAFPLRAPPRHRNRRPDDLFDELHADDAFVQVNHPRLDRHIAYFDLMQLGRPHERRSPALSLDFDAIEVWNGFDLARPHALDEVFHDWLTLLDAGHRVVGTGNSDSHDVRWHPSGWPRTYVRVPGGDAGDGSPVLDALRAGRAFVTSGPFLDATVDGRGPGELAAAPEGLTRVRVVVRTPAWMEVSRVEVWAGVRLVADFDVHPRPGGLDLDRTLEVAVGRAPFVVVVARGDRPMRDALPRDGVVPIAFTNPIWLRQPRSKSE